MRATRTQSVIATAQLGASGKPGEFAMALPELLHVALRSNVSVVGMRVLNREDRIDAR